MAHLKKINLKEFKAILGHDERTLYDKSYTPNNINKDLTKNNFVYNPKNNAQFLEKIIASNNNGRKLRDNTVVAGSWVIQTPKDLKKQDVGKFFKICNAFIKNRYGEANFFNAYTHFDETTPHAHYIVLPIQDIDKSKKSWKFNAKEIFNRKDLQTFHTDLNRFVNNYLGYNVSLLNGETLKNSKGKALDVKQLKSISNDNLKEVSQLKEVIKDTLTDLKKRDLTSYNSFKVSLDKTIQVKEKKLFNRLKGWFIDLFKHKTKVKNDLIK